jgi:hypothetical protein
VGSVAVAGESRRWREDGWNLSGIVFCAASTQAPFSLRMFNGQEKTVAFCLREPVRIMRTH